MKFLILYEYVTKVKGHKDSSGDLAEWVIKSHETNKILSSHKNKKEAEEHLKQMEIHKHMGESVLEEDTRSVRIISTKFPVGLKGISDIHSQAQISGVLNAFGRGVVSRDGQVVIGPVGSSHVGLSQGLQDTKRFYYGYSRPDETVYVVSKNGMDDSYFMDRSILQKILSAIFDKLRLSIGQGGLKIREKKRK